jgi:hypothetical protein
MTEERQRQLLAIYIRNHMGGMGAIFSPFDGLHLTYDQEGTLYKVMPGSNYGENQQQLPLIHRTELFDANDDEIWGVVMEGKPIVREVVEPEPEIEEPVIEKITATRKGKR